MARAQSRAARRSTPGGSVLGVTSVLVVAVIIVVAMWLTLKGGAPSVPSTRTTSPGTATLVAACQSDAQTVVAAVTTYLTLSPGATHATRAELLSAGGGLQTWPSSSRYSISIAGDRAGGGPTAGARLSDGARAKANDVIVSVRDRTADATQDPQGACSSI